MKFTTLLIILGMMHVSAATLAQKISLSVHKVPLTTVFQQIRTQTGYDFAYTGKALENASVVTLDVHNDDLKTVLDRIFATQPLEYSIEDKLVVVSVRQPMLIDRIKPNISQGNQMTIKGIVTDRDNLPMIGVTVKLKGATNAVITDIKGRFSMNISTPNPVLIFAYIGYATKEVAVTDKSEMHVYLEPSQNPLDEVVVVGYGTVKKADLTGAVAQVNMADINKAPVVSFEDALAGRMAGVKVASTQGQPGAAVEIVIRGANSLTQDNSPLYVIDGFPIENPNNSAINPNDIASIEVLKDASATAIYGARGANGVIIIETKKGKQGKAVVAYNASVGIQQVNNKMEMMSPFEFVKLQFELDSTTTKSQYLTGRTLDSYKSEVGYDWQDQIFRTAPMQMHTLSLSGGSDQTKYAVSGSVYDQDGIIVNSGFKRYQGRFALDQTLSKKIKVGINTNYSYIRTFGRVASEVGASGSASSYLLYSVWGYRPINVGGDLSGSLIDPDIDGNNDFRVNPVISTQNELMQRTTRSLIANAYANYQISNDLTLRITGGISNQMLRTDQFFNSQTVQGTPLLPNNVNGSYGSVLFQETNNWLNENTLTWKKTYGEHRLEVLGGFTAQGRNINNYGSQAVNVPNESLGLSGLDEGTPSTVISAISQSSLASFLSRVNYAFKNRYLLTGTIRADGSSKFSDGHKWGYFPSGAFAWKMTDEPFMKSLRFVSQSKLRVSYGLTGNNRVTDFAYLASLNLPALNSYSFNNATPGKGVIPVTLPNSELKWETTTQLDFGYDLSLFSNRISIIADVYQKTTHDLLLNANVPYSTGYATAYRNIGKIQNKGLELTLNTVNIKTAKFSWNSNFNISFNRNKLLALNDNQDNLQTPIVWETAFSTNPLYIATVGGPAASFYGYQWDGVYQYDDFNNSNGVYTLKSDVTTNGATRSSIKPGDIKYKDLNGDGLVDANDRTVIGNPIPKHTGGFSNNFTYKNFDLNVFFQWSYGNDVFNANRIIFEGNALGYRNLNQYASYTERWTPANQSTTLARIGGAGPKGVYSSNDVEDGSFLRLKTVSLGYRLPASFLKVMKISAASFSVSAQNLITWTKYSGMDPEVSVQNTALTPGFDYSAYPRARTISLDLKVSF